MSKSFILMIIMTLVSFACTKGKGGGQSIPPSPGPGVRNPDNPDSKTCQVSAIKGELTSTSCPPVAPSPPVPPPTLPPVKEVGCESLEGLAISTQDNIPATCPALPESPVPDNSFVVESITVAELRDSNCQLHCVGHMLNQDTALFSSTCLQARSKLKETESIFLRIGEKNYSLARKPLCLPHRLKHDQRGRPHSLLGGVPLAFLSINGSIAGVKSPVDPTKTELENDRHGFYSAYSEDVIKTLFALHWTGRQVLATPFRTPSGVPSSGAPLILHRDMAQTECHFERQLGLLVKEGNSEFLWATPLFPFISYDNCDPRQGILHFRVDHILAREAFRGLTP